MPWFEELGCKLHQSLSFSSIFTEIPEAKALYWPGCSLMTLGYPLAAKTAEVLRRSEPDLKIAAACCGKPTRTMDWDIYEKRKAFLLETLSKKGVKRIYTACPNCTGDLSILAQEGDFEVKTIWKSLEENLQAKDLQPIDAEIYLHDPCPLRQDPQTREAVRSLLKSAKIPFLEPEHNGAKTICCGQKEMLHVKNPSASKRILDHRLKEFPEEAIISSYCQSCLLRFGSARRKTAHILELLFGLVEKKGWGSRYSMAQAVKDKTKD